MQYGSRRLRIGAIALLAGMIATGAVTPMTLAVAQEQAGGTATPKLDEGFLRVTDGTRLYYRKLGDGAPSVIVPGDLFTFDGLSALARDRTVVFYDMRNRGRSDAVRDTTTLTVLQDVRDLDDVRRHFRAERMALVGYSYLGLMVMLYALEHPQRVDRVVQLGPAPLRFGARYADGMGPTPPPTLPDSAPLFAARRMQETGEHLRNPREHCELSWLASRHGLVGDSRNVDRLGDGLCHLPNEWPTNLAGHFRHHFPSVQRLDVSWERVESFARPVLVVHGTLDRNAPYGGGREWARRLPNARLLTVKGAAHRAWADEPDVVLSAIDRFLGGAWPESAVNAEP